MIKLLRLKGVSKGQKMPYEEEKLKVQIEARQQVMKDTPVIQKNMH